MIPVVRSSLLSIFPELVCGMSTRVGGVSDPPLGMNLGLHVDDDELHVFENRRLFCDALGISTDQLVTQHQVHGIQCSVVSGQCHVDGNDALITNTAGIALAVGVADCQPVLVYDRSHRAVAAIHAGWRGAAARIVTHALERMRKEFGTRGSDVYAFVGPCASVCCYKVDAGVASEFPSECVYPRERRSTPIDFSSAAAMHADLGRLAESRTAGDGTYMLDLKSASRAELLAFGVPASHIEISPSCTIHDSDLFHSHRRDGARSGRMMAVIGLRVAG